MTKRIELCSNTIVWVGAALAFIVTTLLDHWSGSSNKWDAAASWTFVTFAGVVLFGRSVWKSWRFWMLWLVFLVLHVFGMWEIFGRLLPRMRIGTIYMIPIGVIEAMLLLVIILRLETLLRFQEKRSALGKASEELNEESRCRK